MLSRLAGTSRPHSALNFKGLQILCLVTVTVLTACTRPVLGLDLDRFAASGPGSRCDCFPSSSESPQSCNLLVRQPLANHAVHCLLGSSGLLLQVEVVFLMIVIFMMVRTYSDWDGVPDTTDNCPRVKNPDQANRDGE